MSDWALIPFERLEFAQATASRGAANAKGSYVEVFAATAFNYRAIQLNLLATGGGGQIYLVDIAIGAAGSETVVVSNLVFDSMRGVAQNTVEVTIPVSIPAGSRIAARVQESGGAGTRDVVVEVIGRGGGINTPPAANGEVVTYGVDDTTTTGTLVDPGGTSGTFGAWTEFSAATPVDHSGLIAVLGTNKQSGVVATTRYQVQIGIGPSGGEVPIAELATDTHGNATRMGNNVLEVAAVIPAGTRLAMRSLSGSSADNGRHVSACLLGY